MLPLYVLASFLVVAGSAFSVLRSPSTIDYYRTIVRDGREDPHARFVMSAYYTGLGALIIGLLLLLGGMTYQLLMR